MNKEKEFIKHNAVIDEVTDGQGIRMVKSDYVKKQIGDGKEIKHSLKEWEFIIEYAKQLQKINELLQGIPEHFWEDLNKLSIGEKD